MALGTAFPKTIGALKSPADDTLADGG